MNSLIKSILAILVLPLLYAGFQFASDSPPGQSTGTATSSSVATTSGTFSWKTLDQETRQNSSGILREFNDAIVGITERTNPTVVTITTRQTVRQRFRSPFSFFFDDPRFDQEREFQRSGLGSGVIISEDGYIITNNHVIANADEIVIRTYEGQELDARVVGTDPETDVAVLKVDESGLPAIPLGNSDELRIGELVLAIGSPLNQQFANTVSMGVVSAKGRAGLQLNAYENYIQTDAAINPGNSGGALINMDGELVGINTAIASQTGGYQGLGFAIPVNMARMVVESLIEEGRVVRSYLGITLGAMVDRVMAQALNLDVNYGVVVGEVEPDGPADRAGIKSGDVLLEMDGQPLRDWSQFRLRIASMEPGTEIEFLLFRDGNRERVRVTLAERPEEMASATPEQSEGISEELGFSVMDLNDNIRSQLNLSRDVNGVVVDRVQPGSRAQRQGLQRGDVILRVQDQEVTSANQFYRTMQQLKSEGQDVVLLRVNKSGRNVFIALEF